MNIHILPSNPGDRDIDAMHRALRQGKTVVTEPSPARRTMDELAETSARRTQYHQ